MKMFSFVVKGKHQSNYIRCTGQKHPSLLVNYITAQELDNIWPKQELLLYMLSQYFTEVVERLFRVQNAEMIFFSSFPGES